MKAIYRLKKNKQFNRVYKKGIAVSNNELVLIYCKSDVLQTKIGFSISNKLGKAVKRNKLKRRLKSIIATVADSLPNNLLIVISARTDSATLDYTQLKQSLLQLLVRAQLL